MDDIYHFPVGDDPRDPDVIAYWSGVADRMSRMLLSKDMDWSGPIRDRIREYHAAVDELRAAELSVDEVAASAASRRVSSAAREFPRLKWKLTDNFIRHFGPE